MRCIIALVAFAASAFAQQAALDRKIADLTELIDRKPDFVGAYYARGVTRLSAGQFAEAEQDLSRVIELRPDAAAYASRAQAYSALKRPDPEIADLTEAIRLKPGETNYYLRRAESYRLKGDCQPAIADYSDVIRRFPDMGALRGRAACKKQLGDAAGAAEDDARAQQSMNAILGSIPSEAPPPPLPAPPRVPGPAPAPRIPDTGPSQPGVYRIGGGVSQPSLLFKIEPEYSEEARKAKYQGAVTLSIVVNEFGEPQNVTVIRALGLGLDEKAAEAVRKWVFKPSRKDGQPVAVYATVEVTFHLL